MAPRPSTRNQKKAAPPPDLPIPDPPSTSRPRTRPATLSRAAPTTNEDKHRLLDEFHQAYDTLETSKNDLLAAKGKAFSAAGNAFETSLVSIRWSCLYS